MAAAIPEGTLHSHTLLEMKKSLDTKLKKQGDKLKQVETAFDLCKDLLLSIVQSYATPQEVDEDRVSKVKKMLASLISTSAKFVDQKEATKQIRHRLTGDMSDRTDVKAMMDEILQVRMQVRNTNAGTDERITPMNCAKMKEVNREIEKVHAGNVEIEGDMEIKVETNTRCPITAAEMADPFKSSVCNHSYEKSAIMQLLAQRGECKCPVAGCNQRVAVSNLSRDIELANFIKKRAKREKKKQKKRKQTDDSDSDEDLTQVGRKKKRR